MPSPRDGLELGHFAKIVESSDDAIVSKDLNGTIRSWNPAAERLFGYSAQEAIGRSIRMIIPQDRQTEEDDVLARIRNGQEVTHFETIRQRKDGTLVPISLTVSPVRSDAGEIIGASKIARDISAHQQAVITARRLGAIVDSSDDAIISKNLDSTITTWNRAAERMFGYTAAEAIGQSIRMIIPAESAVRGRRRPGKNSRWPDRRSFRDAAAAQGRDRDSGLADGVADPERRRGGHRRVQDRARHHGASATAAARPGAGVDRGEVG